MRLPLLTAAAALGVLAPAAQAAPRPLSAAETPACTTAEMCADILARHGPQSFDYAVLAAEFSRFGPEAVDALAEVARGPGASSLDAIWPRLDPALAVAVFARLAAGEDTASAAARLLARTDLSPMRERDLALVSPGHLQRAMRVRASDALLRLALRHPPDVARPIIVSGLGAADAATVGRAYQALFEASPDGAVEALRAAMAEAKEPDAAHAAADMLAARFARSRDPFYPRFLDAAATDTALPRAMRDAARAASLGLDAPDAPLTLGPGFSAQLARLAASGREALVRADHLRREGPAILPSWLALADRHPERLSELLDATAGLSPNTAERVALMERALVGTSGGRAAAAALSQMAWTDVGRYQPQLARLARTHPWDSVRAVAQSKLERDVGRAVLSPFDRNAVDRKAAQYCNRGDLLDAKLSASSLPPLPAVDAGGAELFAATSEPPAAVLATDTHVLAGYRGGALVAFDRTTLAPRVLQRRAVTHLLAGPDGTVLVLGGNGEFGTVWRLEAGLERAPEHVADLPAPVRDVFELGETGVLLHFHDRRRPFNSTVLPDGTFVQGRMASPPPLALAPDGALTPGCQGEALVGEAPRAPFGVPRL